jgi:hypothetical protein
MFFHPDDIKIYPKCAKLLQTLDATLSKKVRDAFVSACTADDQFKPLKEAKRLADQALKWGSLPRVDVHEGFVRATADGQVIDACGYQPPFGTANLLIITSIWFDAHEFGTEVDRPRNAHRLTRTVLHEAVHWVRHHVGASDQILIGGAYKGSYEEAGHVFERWAFGDDNICKESELFDALASIGPDGEREMSQRKARSAATP